MEPAGRAFSSQQEHCLWTPIKSSQGKLLSLGNCEGTPAPSRTSGLAPPLPSGMTHVEMLEENVRAGRANLWLLEHHRCAYKSLGGKAANK